MSWQETKEQMAARVAKGEQEHAGMKALFKKHGIENWPRCDAGCGIGWHPLIDTLMAALIGLGWDKDVAQIKEKFGTLRYYIGAGSEDVHRTIEAFEGLSGRTCEECGKYGKRRVDGWHRTLCAPCARTDGRELDEDDRSELEWLDKKDNKNA